MKKVLLLLGLLTLPAGAQIIDPPDPSAPLPTWFSLRTAPPATAPLQRLIASAKEVPAWLREVQTLPPDWLQLGHWPAASTPAGQLYALYGLAKVAPERYCALRGRVKADSPVHSWKGDTGMGLTVGFITSYWESNGVKCPDGRQERDRR